MADDVKLPTLVDLLALPRRARVAFAARCARRVLPLFRAGWPDAPQEHVYAVERAISLAERAADVADAYVADVDAAQAAIAAADAGAAAAADAADAAAAAAAAAAADAVDVAAAADTAASGTIDDAADAASRWRGGVARSRTRAAITRDFFTLCDLAKSEAWSNTTPVPREVFGPMWPEGPPPGWPTDAPATPNPATPAPAAADGTVRGLIATLYAQPETPPEVITEGLVKIYEAANEYHMARGAGTLSVSQFRRWVAEVREPVGGGH